MNIVLNFRVQVLGDKCREMRDQVWDMTKDLSDISKMDENKYMGP